MAAFAAAVALVGPTPAPGIVVASAHTPCMPEGAVRLTVLGTILRGRATGWRCTRTADGINAGLSAFGSARGAAAVVIVGALTVTLSV